MRINVVLDVGANKGWYAEQLRKIGYSGYIFSFEPVLEDFRIIEKKSSTDEKWIAVNKAVGDKDEIKQFNVIESGDEKQTVLSSFLNSSNFEIAKVVDVEVIRLDGFKDQILTELEELRIFLKTDTQGYDLNVWRGWSTRQRAQIGQDGKSVPVLRRCGGRERREQQDQEGQTRASSIHVE